MIHNMINFVIGSVATATTLAEINPEQFNSFEDLLKYLISIVGGILSTIIINILKKRFPEWFTSQKSSKK